MAKIERNIRLVILSAALAICLLGTLAWLAGPTSAARLGGSTAASYSLSAASAPRAVGNSPTDCALNGVVVSSPSPSDRTNQLNAIAAISPNDVWAVGIYTIGGNDNIGQTLTEHWDGATWSIVPSPNVGTSANGLSGVEAFSSSDVWAVGFYSGSGKSTLTEHWDGTAWSVVSSPNADVINYLNSVTIASSNDAWAVGIHYNPSDFVFHSLIEHWNGTAWSVVSHPNGWSLGGITAISSNDVWAVGYASDTNALIEHWNGTAWSVVSHPNPSGSNVLVGLSGTSSNDLWAVGNYSSGTIAQTLVEHWDGSAWSIIPSPNEGSGADSLVDVSAVASTDVWAVGAYRNSGNVDQTLVEHWDGTIWSVVASPDDGSGFNALAGVAASSTDVSAVGYHDGAGSTTQTLAIHGNPTCSTPTATVPPATATATVIPGDFNDVPPGSPFYPYISCLSHRGIISGYACGGEGEPCPGSYFRPGNNVTRGQAAKIVANAAGYDNTIPADQQTFADVPSSSPFWLYVERVAVHGVISGYTCGTEGEPCPGTYFRPGNNLTRGQLAKIDANAAAYNDTIPPDQQTFNDVPSTSPFWLYVERASLHGAIGGYVCGGVGEPCPGTYFRPGNNVTRGQTSKILSITFFPDCSTRR